MENHSFKKAARAIGFALAFGLATTAWGAPASNVANMGFWGQVSGPRECDAVNEDGWCIAWHSVLKGISPARLSQCTAWKCDLRPNALAPVRAPAPDDSLMLQLSVVDHEITPLVLDAQVKPVKAKKDDHQVRVEGPSGTRDDHGPIVPRVIDIPAK